MWHKIVVQKKQNKNKIENNINPSRQKKIKNKKQYKPAPEKKRQKKKWKKERNLNGDSLCTLLTRNTAALWKSLV